MKKILMFSLDNCYPCELQKPLVKKIAKEKKLQLEIIDKDNIKEKELVAKYEVKKFPTILLIENEEIVNTIHGYGLQHSEEFNLNRLIKELEKVNFIS
jgi:thiol-disulfide isomerase/thioredoxin